jgi:hypothetical protein
MRSCKSNRSKYRKSKILKVGLVPKAGEIEIQFLVQHSHLC